MICRRCKTENPEMSRYCSTCGALLTRALTRPRKTVPNAVFIVGSVLALLLAAYFLVPGFRPSQRPAEPATATEETGPAPTEAAATVSSQGRPALVVARFVLEGPAGDLATLDSVLFDGSWAALPLWAFLGPAPPRLESPGPAGALPVWGDWRPASPVVLFRLDRAENLSTPELAPYDAGAGLEWFPLSGERISYAVETGPLRPAGSFRTFALFRGIEGPGVLVQKGAVVGWTFGQGVGRGYLWSPADGAGPKPTLSAADLAAALSNAAPREAAFFQALSASGDGGDLRRLETLAAGFRTGSLLEPEDLPSFLKPSAVAARASALAVSAVERGLAAEVARLLDPRTLAAASDLGLIKSAARAYEEARGFDAVHRLLADLRREPAIQGAAGLGQLEAVEVELAKAALHRVLNEKGYGGPDIYEEAARLAPDDLELHLLGVEVALLEKDFILAGDLLASRRYPTAYADKARTLERLVEEGRREADSVTIRFNPGERLIPVYAVLNGTHRQKFFIDTGATTTIIPPAAVAALGIRIDNSTPVVGFQGVAGSDLAYQVRVDSIEIEGRAVHDLRAIVYDLGDDENAGLLGNDFLQHFQVDLDSIKGFLKLRKK
jgi:predicted aspartyl protease